jgi:dihydrofolate reductase
MSAPLPPLYAIVAMDEGQVIGNGLELPWRIPEDFRWFKQKTMGHSVVMGRKVFDSLGRKPLPGRPAVVVTRDRAFRADGVRVAHTPEDAVSLARGLGDEQPPYVLGGAEIYRALWPLITRIYVTDVPGRHAGDVRFPEVDWTPFSEDGRWAGKTPGLVFRALARAV